MTDQSQPLPTRPSRHHVRHIVRRTLSKSWDDSIFSESAQAAFWCALSLPPLLLGMLGSLAYIAPLFGPATLPTIESQIISTANSFFSSDVVREIIEPTVRDIVRGACGEVVSLGFVISCGPGRRPSPHSSTRSSRPTTRRRCDTPCGSGSTRWGSMW